MWKATTVGTREKVWTHIRDRAPLLRRGEEGCATIEYSFHPSVHACLPPSREQNFPSTSPLLHPACAWPEAACHLWLTDPTTHGKAMTTTAFPGQACPPMGSAPLPWCALANPSPHQEVHHHCGKKMSALPTLGKCPNAVEEVASTACPWDAICSAEHQGKPCPATGNASPSWRTPASPACPQEACRCRGVTRQTPPALGKCSAATACPRKPQPAVGNAHLPALPPSGSEPLLQSDWLGLPTFGKCLTASFMP